MQVSVQSTTRIPCEFCEFGIKPKFYASHIENCVKNPERKKK